MAKDPTQQINSFFKKHSAYFDKKAPGIIAKTAVEYYKGAFRSKSFDGKPWPAVSKTYKPKRGSLMVRSGKLMNSIQDTLTTPSKVVISAGNSKVPYAKIHNEGGEIKRAARSETFRRRRKRSGKFRKGTIANRKGMTFKASTSRMPKRQFMGYAVALNNQIFTRLKAAYKFK